MNLGDRKASPLVALIPILILGAFVIIGGWVIGSFNDSLFPVKASAEAEQIDQLFQVLLGIGGAVFLLVQGLLLYSVLRFRTRPEDMSDGPNFHGNTMLELVWTAIPAVIVFFLVIYSYNVWESIRAEQPGTMEIDAVGQRFNWTFTYEDPLGRLADASQQTFSSAELHVYVGRPMLLRLYTEDVNHAFWVPAMRIKQDLLAGKVTEIRFTPTVVGRYRVVCAELCGGGHGQMFTYVNVYADEAEFMGRFIDPAVDYILNPPDDPVLNGRIVIGNYGCNGCHTLDDLGWVSTTGPNLTSIGSTAGRRPAPSAEFYLAESIRHPNDYITPGFQRNVMPQFGPDAEPPAVIDGGGYRHMSDVDLVNIVAYLCTQTGGDDSPCGDIEAIREAVAAQREE